MAWRSGPTTATNAIFLNHELEKWERAEERLRAFALAPRRGRRGGRQRRRPGEARWPSRPQMTREVYGRDVLVGANRVAEARAKFRKKKAENNT
ncbi:MAG: hypothetical protein WCF20_12200 [Methylovirgula sp.]